MFIIRREEDEIKTTVGAYVEEDIALTRFVDKVLSHASNAEEYTVLDIESIKENREERVGPIVYTVEEISPLSEESFRDAGGHCCIHCLSEDIEAGDLKMCDGYVSRDLECNVCSSITTEQYSLSGYEGN